MNSTRPRQSSSGMELGSFRVVKLLSGGDLLGIVSLIFARADDEVKSTLNIIAH